MTKLSLTKVLLLEVELGLPAPVLILHSFFFAASNYNTIEAKSANTSEDVADALWPVFMRPTKYQDLPQLVKLQAEYCPTTHVVSKLERYTNTLKWILPKI